MEARVPERAIRIRIINIISFHCDPLRGPLHTQGQNAAEYCGKSIQSAVNLSHATPPNLPEHAHTHITEAYTHARSPQWLNCSLRDDRGEAAVVAVVGGPPGPEGRHTMERAADQRSGEIELEIFHGWLA